MLTFRNRRETGGTRGHVFGEQIGGGTGTTHKFTGQERDAESGLDKLGRRYYDSSTGRFTSPDPITVSARRLINPQIWNMYSYVGNNPLNSTDPLGEELVQLGQHSDDEIKKRKNQIGTELKNKQLSKEDRAKLNAERNTLDLEKKGNAIAGAYLAALDKVGQRNGLKLSDITLTTDTKNDFAKDSRVSSDQMARITNPNAQAFVIEQAGQIYLKAEGSQYRLGVEDRQNADIGGSIMAHEQVHRDFVGTDGDEAAAFTRQKTVFNLFKNDFQNNMDRFNFIENQIQEAIQNAKKGGN